MAGVILRTSEVDKFISHEFPIKSYKTGVKKGDTKIEPTSKGVETAEHTYTSIYGIRPVRAKPPLNIKLSLIYLSILLTIFFTNYYLSPGGVARYCFHHFCLSVCVCLANILVLYFSAIRRDIDLKFIQDGIKRWPKLKLSKVTVVSNIAQNHLHVASLYEILFCH